MKTAFIDCSPKRRFSASGFIASVTRIFVSGKKVQLKLRTQKDFKTIFSELEDTDTIVFSMPLYVDGVPSHVLPFLKEMEVVYKSNNTSKNVYVIANNGFIEGKQNETLMQIMENFCDRANFNWCGGLGIGGGVMLNVMRILLGVICLISLFQAVVNGFNLILLKNFTINILEIFALSCGIISYDIWLAHCINKKRIYGKHYTRIMLPSFVFILIADIFFTIISLFQGGIFRGWFSKKKIID